MESHSKSVWKANEPFSTISSLSLVMSSVRLTHEWAPMVHRAGCESGSRPGEELGLQ